MARQEASLFLRGSARRVRPAGFVDVETFSFDVHVPYTQEGWRGRIRASAGIGRQFPPEEVAVRAVVDRANRD